MREEKEKGVKENGGFMRAEEENQTEQNRRIYEENRNKSWSSNTQKIKNTDCLDNMGVTSRTEPIINYQEGQNIMVKDHKINIVTHQTDNTIMIYNETTKEAYIYMQDRIKPKSSSNHNTDKLNIHVAKLKQEIQRKDGEQEARKTEIMKEV